MTVGLFLRSRVLFNGFGLKIFSLFIIVSSFILSNMYGLLTYVDLLVCVEHAGLSIAYSTFLLKCTKMTGHFSRLIRL